KRCARSARASTASCGLSRVSTDARPFATRRSNPRIVSRRRAHSVAHHSAAIALTAPQVVAHRLVRMALSGPVLSARDRREFTRMGAEKVAAVYESWDAMLAQRG